MKRRFISVSYTHLDVYKRQTISRLEQNLGKIRSVTSMLDEGLTPEELLGLVLEGMDLSLIHI